MKKNEDLKQSKISRHEVAKQKFRYFQRSMSCKSLNNKGDFIPGPGQFAILQNNQKKKVQQASQLPNINTNQKKHNNLENNLKFTTNLKLITRQRSPSRVSQLLNETVNTKIQQRRSLKKITKSQSSGNLRPMTSISTQLMTQLQGKNSLKESKIISNAADYDKKYYFKKQFNQNNTFMIKSRSVIPKHAYGHKSIKLGQQDNQRRLKIEKGSDEVNNQRKFTKIRLDQQDQIINQNEQGLKANFLPIQYYMIDDQKPQNLIQKYKIQQNILVGYSKWQELNGQYEWKKCRVIDYIKSKQRWQIQWLHNGKRKIVARNNLYFQKQSFGNFQKIINTAQSFRKKSQVFMKYNWLIDNMKNETHVLENQQIARIIKMVLTKVNSYQNPQQLTSSKAQHGETLMNILLNQIKQKYIRANHIVQFNAGLPFNQKHKQQFRGYLPQEYFYPNLSINKVSLQTRLKQKQLAKSIPKQQSTQTFQIPKITIKPSQQMKKLFQQNTKKFKLTTSLTSIHRIQIIQFLNKSQFLIKNQRITSHQLDLNRQQQIYPLSHLKYFSFFINKINNIQDVRTKLQNSIFESVTKLNNIVCDIQYYVAKELDPVYMDRKNYGYQEFQILVKKYRKFLKGVNMRVQNIARDILFEMIQQLTQLIHFQQNLLTLTPQTSFFDKLVSYKNKHSLLKLKLKIQLKGQTIQCTPKKQQILSIFNQYVQKLVKQFSTISCVRKSYIQQLRPHDKMKIIEIYQENENMSEQTNSEYSRVVGGTERYQRESQCCNEVQGKWQINPKFSLLIQILKSSIQSISTVYTNFFTQTKDLLNKILILQSQIKRKTSKKCTFSEIQQFITQTKQINQTIYKLKSLTMKLNIDYSYKNNCDQMVRGNKEENGSENNLIGNKTSQQTPLLSHIHTPSFQQQNSKALIFNYAKNLKTSTNQPKYIKVGIFCFNIDDLVNKLQNKMQQISHDLYKLVLQKITKQNQKLQKNIDLIVQKLQTEPTNIKQMILLQQYIHQQASQQLYKINNKITQLHLKFTLLQKINLQIDYKDFYECHKIYMKPIKIKTIIQQRIRSIQSEYKKKFGQNLVKETNDILNQIKQIQQKFYSSIQINSIEEMDSSFLVFSKLKEKIQNAISRTNLINEYQTAMKWINTNFQRLIQIKDEFLPYYQLISLQKNYKFHIEIQLTQSLHTIDANKICQDVVSGCDQLNNLEMNVFANNPKILEIVQQISEEYKRFREKLPLLQILRNSDLRERHWVSIKNLTGFDDILSQKITFADLQARQIKKYQKKLIQISHIATRQLIYQKRLNKMKKQWKQLKILTQKISQYYDQSNNLQQIKIISNIQQIQIKTQNDIYQVQQILSSSFIKFLQKDIINWRNYVLYKMYEFIQIWKNIEKEILSMHQIFAKKNMKIDAAGEYGKFKALEKNWKNIMNQIQQQPNLLELLQTKINQSLKYTVELIEELKKAVNMFFEKKKQRFSRFGSLSHEELIALFSNNDEKQIFDQAVRKCLHGVKNVVRNQVKKITCVKTHLDQQIHFNQGVQSSGIGDSDSPDKIIQDIQKRIKKSLRNSIDDINGQRSTKILQIILFHQRIIFTRQIQLQLLNQQNTGINDGYINALLVLKSKIIQALFKQYESSDLQQAQNQKFLNLNNNKSKKSVSKKQQNLIKIQSELNQLINHLDIAQTLYNKNISNLCDFQWLMQIRTYQKNNSYYIEIGLNKLEYGFQITDQQQFIVQQNSSRMFLNISMAIKQKMFSSVKGNIGMGKLASLHYLANIHGKNQNVLNCHKAISYENVFDFFRMAANGIWIVYNNINLLSTQVLSYFRQSSQLFWANYPTTKSKSYFILGDKTITFSTHQIGLFGTINLNKNTQEQYQQIHNKLSSYYRTFSLISLDIKYVLQCKLLLAGFQYYSNIKKFIKMIQLIEYEYEKYYMNMNLSRQKKEGEESGYGVNVKLMFSKLNFIQKIILFAKEFKNLYKGKNVDDYLILQLSLNKSILQITKNLLPLKTQILQKLKNHFNFIIKLPFSNNPPSDSITQQPSHQNHLRTSQPSHSQPQGSNNPYLNQHEQLIKRDIKKLFLDKKLYSNRKIINSYYDILQTLKQKHSIIVLGNCSTGKSTLIELLAENKIQRQISQIIAIKGGQGEVNASNIDINRNRNVFINDFRITLNYVHPNAYSLTQLYGDINSNGIVNCLIKNCYENMEKAKGNNKGETVQINKKDSLLQSSVFNNIGIVFDSQISHWIQPLLPFIRYSSTYIQPNGKNLIIQRPIKLIFQCRDLTHVSPSIILSTNIVQLQNQLKWQNIFSHYLKKNFKPYYQKKVFIDFCELMVTFVMEPILEFFKTSISSNKNSLQNQSLFVSEIYHSFLKNQINYIPLIFNLFISLIQSYFPSTNSNKKTTENKQSLNSNNNKHGNLLQMSKKNSQSESISQPDIFSTSLDEKQKSVILNIFLMSITWTIGNFIPEESKKTFSRHFKYLIKRAIQLNIKNIQKDTLPKDDQDLFEICFIEYKWHPWAQVPQILNKSNNIITQSHKNISNSHSITLNHKIKYLYLLDKYCQTQIPFFILGKNSTGKNSLMLQYLNSKSNQVYNKILIACTPNSTHINAKKQLKRQIQKQKYSHTFKGFVHGKTTLFYLCDLNLPLTKNDISLNQFLHNYIKRKGWFLQPTDQFFQFKNINFCGTLNSQVKFSQYLLKYLNPLLFIQTQAQIKNKIFNILSQNQFLNPYRENIIHLITNIQEVISRQLKNKLKVQITYKDIEYIAHKMNQKISSFLFEGAASMTKSSKNLVVSSLKIDQYETQKMKKNKILQFWIVETQRKYLEKFGSNYDKEKIFYFINNVLMEEQRVRYKSLMPSDSFFISNISYYLNKLTLKENKEVKKNITKKLNLSSSYKIYQNLDSIKEELKVLDSCTQRSYLTEKQEQQINFSNQVEQMIQNSKQQPFITKYLQNSISLLDYISQPDNHINFIINDLSSIEQNPSNPKPQAKQQISCTIKKMFKNQHPTKPLHKKSKQKQQEQIKKLLSYIGKITNSQILEYKRMRSQNQAYLDWKIFINELFELINSPSSSHLNQFYIIYLAGVYKNQNFILQDLIKLKRTGTLDVLEEYLNSQEIDFDENLEREEEYKGKIQEQSEGMNSQKSISSQIENKYEYESNYKKEKYLLEKKRQLNMLMRKNITQNIREKILKKIRFVISIDQQKINQIKQNYQILLQKSHILWKSHIFSHQQTTNPLQQKNLNSLKKISNNKQTSIKQQTDSSKKLSEQQSLSSQQKNPTIIRNSIQNNIQLQSPINLQQIIQTSYTHHKQTFNHFISYKEVKQIYIALQENLPNQVISRISDEIQGQKNLEFLYFLNLFGSIKNGIEKKVNKEIGLLEQEIYYFQNLSQKLYKQLCSLIVTKKEQLQKKQIQLKLLNQNLQKTTEQNQKYQNYFTKSQQAISLLQKQSKQSNVLYENYIKRQKIHFSQSQTDLVQVLKTAKDKKIILTNEMKSYLQLLGLIINKKLKPEENMIKEIIKDIANLKVHKKVSNLYVEYPLNQKPNQKSTLVGQKSIVKLKQFITKFLPNEFAIKLEQINKLQGQPKPLFKPNKDKQNSLSQSLLECLKQYFTSLLIYYNKSQEQPVKNIFKKCNKYGKQLEKIRNEYQKSIKSKEYANVQKELETLRNNKKQLQNSYKSIGQEYQRLRKLQNLSIQILYLKTNGQLDQKSLLSKQFHPNSTQSNSAFIQSKLITIIQQKNKNLVIQKIKQTYVKTKQQIIAINNIKDIISLLISLKLVFTSSLVDVNVLNKYLSNQALNSIRSINVNAWQKLFMVGNQQSNQNKSQKQQSSSRGNNNNKLVQIYEGIQYFTKYYKNQSSFSVLNGLIIIQSEQSIQTYLKTHHSTTHLFKFQNSLFQKLNSFVSMKSKTPKQSHSQEQQKIYSPQQIIIFIEIKSILEYSLFKEYLREEKYRNVNKYLKERVIVLIVDESSIMSQIMQTRSTQYQFISQSFQIHLFKLTDQSSKFITQIEQKLESELLQQKKQSDLKLLSRYNELMNQMDRNEENRKRIVREFREEVQKNTSEGQGKHIIQYKEQKLLQPELHTIQNLQSYLTSLKQNIHQFYPIKSSLQSLPNNISNIKKRTNIHSTKLIKFIIKVYYGFLILQEQNQLFYFHKNQQIYIRFVQDIIRKQKQLFKNQNISTKFYKNIKNKMLEFYLNTFNSIKIYVSLIFILSAEDNLSKKQFQKLFKLIIKFQKYSKEIVSADSRIYKHDAGYLSNQSINSTNKQNSPTLTKQYIIQNLVLVNPLSTSTTKNKHSQSLQQQQILFTNTKDKHNKTHTKQKPQLSQQFLLLLDLLSQTFNCFQNLKPNFLKKIDTWLDLFKNIDTKYGQNIVNTLPEPYNDINRVYFGLFVALIDPQNLTNWINVHLIEEDLLKVSEFKQESNQQRILNVKKYNNYKQSIVIGDNVINKLYDISGRAKKQIKLYSKLQIQKKHSKPLVNTSQSSYKPSPMGTKKDIQISKLNYFNNRKSQQQFLDDLYQCIKNSSWLVIDIENFKTYNQVTGQLQLDLQKLQSIVKLIDFYTLSGRQNNNNDYQDDVYQPVSNKNNSLSSQKNMLSNKFLGGSKSYKNEFAQLNHQDYQYHVFFVCSNSLKQQILKTPFLYNQTRCVLHLTPYNEIHRQLHFNKSFYQQLLSNKKLTKDYDSLSITIKQIVYYLMQSFQKLEQKLFEFECKNQENVYKVGKQLLIEKNFLYQFVDKINKLVFNMITEPEIVNQYINKQKTVVTTKAKIKQEPTNELQDDQSQEHSSSDPKIIKKSSNQASKRSSKNNNNNSRFYKQKQKSHPIRPKRNSSKISINSSQKQIQQENQQQQHGNKKPTQTRITSINKSKKQIQAAQKNKSNTTKYHKILGIIKLLSTYLQSTFSSNYQKVNSIYKMYQSLIESYLMPLNYQRSSNNNNNISKNSKEEKHLRIQEIFTVQNKLYSTSNRSILENLLNYVKQEIISESSSKGKHLLKYKQLFNGQQQTTSSSIISSNAQLILQKPFNTLKTFIQRVYYKFQQNFVSQIFIQKIQKLYEIKKKCQIQQNQLKKQLFKQQILKNLNSSNDNFINNQFNFQSLTQNLTVEEMRKKLHLNKKNTLGNQNKLEDGIKKVSVVEKIKLFLYQLKEKFILKLDKKILLLKSFKSIFFLNKINYQNLQSLKNLITSVNNIEQIQEQLVQITNKAVQQTEYLNQNNNFILFKNSQNFNVSKSYSSSSLTIEKSSGSGQKKLSSNPMFNLQNLASTQLLQLIQLLKQYFGQINNHKPPNIKTHFILEDVKDERRVYKDYKKQLTLYKVCSFSGFGVYNIQRGETSIMNRGTVVMNVSQKVGFNKNTEGLKLGMYFQQEDQQSDFQSSQEESSSQQENQHSTLKRTKQFLIPFYLTRLTQSQSLQQSFINKTLNSVNVKIHTQKQKSPKQKQNQFSNAFVYY